MKGASRSLLLAVLCVSNSACTAASDADYSLTDVEAPVKRFLDFYFNEYKRGLPEESQLPELASFTSPNLVDLFQAAMKGEDCYLNNDNYEGPSPVQGDLFSSLFEGGTSATYRQIARDTDTATFEIEWTNDVKWLSPEPFVWHDRVFLVRVASGWRIADFTHDGTWEFMKKGNVSQNLRDVAKECNRP